MHFSNDKLLVQQTGGGMIDRRPFNDVGQVGNGSDDLESMMMELMGIREKKV